MLNFSLLLRLPAPYLLFWVIYSCRMPACCSRETKTKRSDLIILWLITLSLISGIHHTIKNIKAPRPLLVLKSPPTLVENRRPAMCDYEEFLFECGHSTILLKSHCHFARNDPNHQCLGVKVLRESWRQEGQLCGACFDDGYRFDNSNRVICHLSSLGGPAYNRHHHLQHQHQHQQQQHRRRR